MSILKLIVALLASVSFYGLTFSQASRAAADPSRIFRDVSPSVVTITSGTATGQRQGSAVAIRSSFDERGKINGTWLATNAHVVSGGQSAQVNLYGRNWTAKVQYQDQVSDVAILHAPDLSLPILKPYGANAVVVGSSVFAVGSPLGLDRSLSEGIVSALRQDKGVQLVQTTAAISPGSSGGALVDAQSRLIAITTFKIRGGDSLNFAVDSLRAEEIFSAISAASLFQAVYLRKAVLLGSEEDKNINFIESDALTKWMLETSRPDGTVTHKWFLSRISATTPSEPHFFGGGNPEFEKFQAEFLLTRPLSSTTQIAVEQSASIRLACRMHATRDGTYQYDMNVIFDAIKQTVNGLRATVTQDEISFQTGKEGAFKVTVDRFSMRARVDNISSPNLLNGVCTKLEDRKF